METYFVTLDSNSNLEIKLFNSNATQRRRANGKLHFVQYLTHRIPLFEEWHMHILNYTIFYTPKSSGKKVYYRLYYAINKEKRKEERKIYYQKNKPGAWRILLKTQNFATSTMKEA